MFWNSVGMGVDCDRRRRKEELSQRGEALSKNRVDVAVPCQSLICAADVKVY